MLSIKIDAVFANYSESHGLLRSYFFKIFLENIIIRHENTGHLCFHTHVKLTTLVTFEQKHKSFETSP